MVLHRTCLLNAHPSVSVFVPAHRPRSPPEALSTIICGICMGEWSLPVLSLPRTWRQFPRSSFGCTCAYVLQDVLCDIETQRLRALESMCAAQARSRQTCIPPLSHPYAWCSTDIGSRALTCVLRSLPSYGSITICRPNIQLAHCTGQQSRFMSGSRTPPMPRSGRRKRCSPLSQHKAGVEGETPSTPAPGAGPVLVWD